MATAAVFSASLLTLTGKRNREQCTESQVYTASHQSRGAVLQLGVRRCNSMAALAAPCPPGSLTFRRAVSSTQCLTASTSRVAVPRQPCMQPVEARVAIRFTRFGRKKVPFYRIIAIDSRSRRDGLPIENLGWYDPLRKETNLNAPAIKKWLSVGAQPSDTVRALLKKAMVID